MVLSVRKSTQSGAASKQKAVKAAASKAVSLEERRIQKVINPVYQKALTFTDTHVKIDLNKVGHQLHGKPFDVTRNYSLFNQKLPWSRRMFTEAIKKLYHSWTRNGKQLAEKVSKKSKILGAPLAFIAWFGKKFISGQCLHAHVHKRLSCSEFTMVMSQLKGNLSALWRGSLRILGCNPITAKIADKPVSFSKKSLIKQLNKLDKKA